MRRMRRIIGSGLVGFGSGSSLDIDPLRQDPISIEAEDGHPDSQTPQTEFATLYPNRAARRRLGWPKGQHEIHAPVLSQEFHRVEQTIGAVAASTFDAQNRRAMWARDEAMLSNLMGVRHS